MDTLADPVERVAADTGFSGVVRSTGTARSGRPRRTASPRRDWAWPTRSINRRYATLAGELGLEMAYLDPVDAGFVITRVLEPEPSPALAASHPDRADVPMFLVVRAARLP
jgi:hypothetical protein